MPGPVLGTKNTAGTKHISWWNLGLDSGRQYRLAEDSAEFIRGSGEGPREKGLWGVGVTRPCRSHVTGVGWQGVGQRGTRVARLAGYVWTGG